MKKYFMLHEKIIRAARKIAVLQEMIFLSTRKYYL